MTTVEKLLLQIFERKNSIIELLRKQTESYSYHLASKSLINGISPPSWLCNPNTSDSEELKKEELISKLLRPQSQPPASWSFTQYPGYSNLGITGDNEEFCDRVSRENSSCSEGLNIHNDPAVPTLHSDDRGDLNCAPELDASVNSPEDQTDERITNICNAPHQFLAGIKRSKSRQKALVLRSSAKAIAKSGSRRLSISDVDTCQIRFSLSATDQAGQTDELPQLAEPCAVDGQSCEEINLDEAVGTSREMEVKALELHSSAKTLAKSGLRRESITDVVSSQTRSSISDTDRAGLNDELPQLAEPCAIGIQSCEEMNFDEADSTCREMGMDTYCDIETKSRICTEVPVSVKGYSTSGCSSEDFKENTFSHVAKARRTEPIPLSHFENADKYVKSPKSGGPPTTAKITLSTISRERQNRGSGSSNSSSGNNQGVDYDMIGTRNALSPEFVDGSGVEESLCNVPNGGWGARESILEDLKNHKVRNTFPSRSCIEHNARAVEVSNLEESFFTAEVDGVVLVSSSAVSERQVNDSHDVSKLGQPTVRLSRRLTRSQTRTNDKKSDCELKFAEDLQNTASGQSALACYGVHNMIHDDKSGGFFMESELVLHDHIDQSCSSSHYTMRGSGLQEAQVASALPVSSALVDPKQFDCKETEEYNVKAFTFSSGKRKLGDLPEKMRCSLSVLDNDISLGKGLCGSTNMLSLGKHSPEMSDASREGLKNHRDTFETDVQENPGTHAENFEPVDTMLKATEDYTVVGPNCKLSEAHHETDSMLSKISDISNIQNHPAKLPVERRLESSPMRDLEEGDWTSEEKDKGHLVSSAPENSSLSHYHSSDKEPAESYGCLINEIEMINPIALYESEQFAAQQSQLSSCLGGEVQTHRGFSSLGDNVLGTHSTIRIQGENSSVERRFTRTCMESWPQIKRRKIEHEKAHSFATPFSFLENMSDSIHKSPVTTCLKTMENVDTVFVEHVNKSSDVGFSTELNSMEGRKSSLLSIHGEVRSCSDINNELLQATLLSSLTMKDSRTSTSLSNSNLFDTVTNGEEQCSKLSCTLEKNANCTVSENMKNSSTMLEGMQSLKWEGNLHPPQSVLPLNNEDPQLTDFDQSMPVFEGFTVDTPTESGELNFAAGGFDYDSLILPRSTFERASILAEIYRSTSLDGPSSQFSSALETQNIFQSLPNGRHLEHLDLGETFPLNSDIGKHLQSGSSSSDDYKDASDGMPYTVSLAYTGARYGWSPRNQHTSPVGKLWDRLSSLSGSSEKRSSNPELTCFPIEEDPSDSDENKTMDESSSDVHGEIDSSLGNHSDKRQPLKDLTNLSLNTSVSVEEETANNVCEDFMSTKSSVTGTHEKVSRGPEYRNMKKSENSHEQTFSIGSTNTRKNQHLSIGANSTRKNQHLSIGANRMKKAKESINNSICKPIVSNKTSLQAQKQKLSLKEPTRNNIVSNVSSFIPLIQQKQAATACAGKGNVKVKALEAAENAKRLEEKKEIERKLKKEAMKFERAKLEEKNMRHMELEKKRKEEERKKKDAEIVAKKRLREQEERKEKEKKKMRLEVRQRQREQGEKKRVEKAGKENQRSKDEQINSKKELQNEPKKQLYRETTNEYEVALQKADTGTSGLSCEAEKAMQTMDKSPRNEDLIAKNSQGKSYEISPYQGSDDEDDELPPKKYFPSWASKSSVALFLPLQQEMDPGVIFPPESFCSVDEVLLPRKLQKSQVAA